MRMRAFSLLFASLLSTNTVADELAQLCSAGGYYSGAQDRFMSGLAIHILQARGELGSKKCSSIWQASYEVGERLSKAGEKMKATDSVIVDDVSAFSKRVYSSIAKGAGY